MELFPTEPTRNLLPFDGEVYYYGEILTGPQSDFYFKTLFDSIEWRNDEARIFGKHIITSRKVAWYAEEKFPYRYSGSTKYALAWTPELLELKKRVEELTQTTYNSCLLNLYHSGKEGMAWHSDNEAELKQGGSIASVSLGTTRKFAFKHKSEKKTISLNLSSGSLLEMTGQTQNFWLHRLPPMLKVTQPRINLTFRTIQKREN
jgi:alkylated DNA repair dioxygenase AlkB